MATAAGAILRTRDEMGDYSGSDRVACLILHGNTRRGQQPGGTGPRESAATRDDRYLLPSVAHHSLD